MLHPNIYHNYSDYLDVIYCFYISNTQEQYFQF